MVSMAKYKVGDKVLIQGKISEIEVDNNKVSYWVNYGGYDCFSEKELLESHKTYEDGLNDAWELAKKIVMSTKAKANAYTGVDLTNIFGDDHTTRILNNLTPQEALAKIEEYEESKAIKVGDVVKSKDSELEFVLTAINGAIVQGVTRNGDVYNTVRKHVEKTGRHIDISSILEQIRENE
jgi:hypothetical protein